MSNPRRLVEAVEITESGVHVVRLMRIFDAASVNEFEKVLAYLMARGHFKLVVDLTNVEFVASAGWGALTSEFRRVHDNGGDIRLAGMNPDVLDVFFLLELDSFMSAYDSLEAALSSFENEQSHVPTRNETPAPAFETMIATEPVGVARESVVVDDAIAPEPAARTETKRKRRARTAETALREIAADAPAADVATARPEPAAPPPLVLGPQNTASSQDGALATAPASAEADVAEANEEFSALPAEAKIEGRVNARENAPASTPGAAASGSKKSKPQNKAKRPKAEPFPRSRKKREQAPADLFSREEKTNAAAVHAPPLLVSEAVPASAPALNGENRDNNRPASIEAQAGPALDDIELQDIHDPWLIDEIDSLPEEFEMEEGGWQEERMDFAEMEPDSSSHEEVAPSIRLARAAASNKNFEAPVQAKRSEAARAVVMAAAPMADFAAPPAPIPSSQSEAFVKKSSAPKTKRPPRKRASTSVLEHVPAEVVPALGDLPITRQAGVNSRDRSGEMPRPLHESIKAVKVSSEDDCVELVRQIVKEHPHYGPTMIGKFFETRVDPPVKTSRSTIYRWLRLAGLNTRDQRRGFAGDVEASERE